VTGSLHAGFGQWLIATGRAPERYVASQGARLGRAGRVHVARERTSTGDRVWVGGDVVTVITGSVRL
jgi:predicted PhzF superfamily epimerase YddE/YHI9